MVTVIIKTIGPTGRDYTTFALAEADTSNIGTSADLVANDEAIVFEADDTTFTTASTLNIANTALTVDATRNVSYTAASGRPVYEYTGTGRAISFFDPYTRWSGIDVLASSGSAATQVRANSGYGAAQAGTVIENAALTAAVAAVSCEKFATGHALGTSSEPITLRNLVTKSIIAVGQSVSGTGHTTGAHCLVVNCTHLGGSSPNQAWNWELRGGMPDASFKIINCANLAQNTSNDANITGGGVDVSGSTNNIGNAAASSSSFRFENIGGGIGAQYTPTTSFSTPLGSGDFAVYMGATGALADKPGNDVWQQGVGPGSNSDVPTTDINGVARSGASCNPGAFEADGFVAPTVTTQTIGPVGRDFATFTLAEASLPSEDITFTNRAFVFEADAGTYSENVSFSSSLTTDATRQVTYKPAAGSEHGGVPSTGVVLQSTTGITAFDDHMTLRGLCYLQTSTTTSGSTGIGLLFDQIIYEYAAGVQYGTFMVCTSALFPSRWQNSVLFAQGVSGGDRRGFIASHNNISGHVEVVNCTVVAEDPAVVGFWTQTFGTGTCQFKLVNCVRLGASIGKAFNNSGSGSTVTGSNNFGPSTNPFPAALQGSPYPITASTAYDPGAGDFALYVGKNGALLDSPHNDVIDGGVGPASNSDVPTTDILGDTRSGTTTNPGAFALAQATAVLTRTIGPVGRDYATFTAAEADVENIGGSADLVFENERIEFLADAGTYTTILNPNSGLTTDATRNVTYKPAVGSEHGGVVGAGVVIDTGASNSPVFVDDDFTVIDGLNLATTTMYCAWILGSGIVMRNCIATAVNRGFLIYGGQSSAPNILENCVSRGGTSFAFLVLGGGPVSADAHARIVNCTGSSTGNDAFRNQATVSGTSATAEYINCLSLSSPTYQTIGSFATATGSNNFGGSSNPFPVSLQGSPYPITPTTNTTPGFGDYAIYEAATGALIVVDDNAALGGGVGPAANSDVPVFDIRGVKRIGGGCDPGAFEGVRSRSLDVWDVVAATHTTPGTFGELLHQVYLLTRTAAGGRIV